MITYLLQLKCSNGYFHTKYAWNSVSEENFQSEWSWCRNIDPDAGPHTHIITLSKLKRIHLDVNLLVLNVYCGFCSGVPASSLLWHSASELWHPYCCTACGCLPALGCSQTDWSYYSTRWGNHQSPVRFCQSLPRTSRSKMNAWLFRGSLFFSGYRQISGFRYLSWSNKKLSLNVLAGPSWVFFLNCCMTVFLAHLASSNLSLVLVRLRIEHIFSRF